MGTTEETPESSSVKRSSLVDDFLESGRKKAKTSLSTDNQHIEDLEYMLKSVRALIKIINEIWDKCKGRLISSENCESPFTFKRYLCEKARVEKNGRSLTITTKVESNTKDFGSLPDLSKDMSKLVSIDLPESENEVLPDYNKYLEKSSVLCKVVLLPFLTGFKEHLENVQVYLGQIEAWLLETEVVISFLEKTFDNPDVLRMRDDKDPSKINLYCSYCLDVDSKMEIKYNLCTEDGRKVLKAALAFVKTFKPVTQIEVKDAGEKAVNGMYTIIRQCNSVYGVYFYSHSGLWNGKPVTFYLARQKNKKRWGVICMDASKKVSIDKFYWTKATGEKYELPPMDGWGIEGNNNFNGVNPPPKILYKIDD